MTLELQKFLRADGSPEKLKEQFGIISRRHGRYDNLVCFKYHMIDSPMGERIVQECRGIILDEEDNWNVVSRSFNKFFNIFEGHAAEIDWDTACVQEKLDGCLHEETSILTEDGAETIGNICRDNYQGKVISFNHDEQLFELDEIVGLSIQESSEDWYEIELENGTILILTGNHKVFLPEIDAYRRVDEISPGDQVLEKLDKTI
ncbi:hypothetical protein LCGC14_1401830 [marine sediment metagenome]|uniref:Hint domain-containing protein n=1 Tax=marine sediment metagenome TaxID=412755 RepID=A0A0F9JX64_9ZZZZ